VTCHNVRLLRCGDARGLRRELESMGIAPHDRPTLQTKGRFRLVKVEGVPSSATKLLQRVVRDRGGEVVLSKDSLLDGESVTDLLIMAAEQALSNMVKIVHDQRFPHVQEIAKEIELALSHLSGPQFRSCRIGQRDFAWGERTYVMGILNVTPDSFSGDGLLQDGETTTMRRLTRLSRRPLDFSQTARTSSTSEENRRARGPQPSTLRKRSIG